MAKWRLGYTALTRSVLSDLSILETALVDRDVPAIAGATTGCRICDPSANESAEISRELPESRLTRRNADGLSGRGSRGEGAPIPPCSRERRPDGSIRPCRRRAVETTR